MDKEQIQQIKQKPITKQIVMGILAFVTIVVLFFATDLLLGLNNTQKILDLFKGATGTHQNNDLEESLPLAIVMSEGPFETYENFASIQVVSNKEIEIEENQRLNLIEMPKDPLSNDYEYVLEITNLGIGDSTVRVNFKEKIKPENIEQFGIRITRYSYSLPTGQTKFEPWPNTTYVSDGSDLLAFVTKNRRLLSTFEPNDLVDLNKEYFLYTNVPEIMLQRDAAEALKTMVNTMQNEIGKNVVIASGYRSYNNQVQTYSGWVRQLGQKEADNISARPGYSEHQLGTVVDLFSEDSGLDFTAAFDTSPAGQWLLANAHNFGYIQTYPKGSENITGYAYEAWHWRYIGMENAKELKESGKIWFEWASDKLNTQTRSQE